MKSDPKIKPLFVIALGIVITFSVLIIIDLNSNTGNRDKVNGKDGNLEISAVAGKIQIIYNSGWVNFKNAGNCTGSGTYSDPYVIEDLEIDGGGSGNCIWIENSTVHFKIENCTVSNSGTGYPEAGIRLSYVNNSQLIDNDCSSNYHGIRLYNSNNNTVSRNTANNNTNAGIYLGSSTDNTISGNTANYNSQYDGYAGIYLTSSSNNTISGNTANNNSNGIFLDYSSNNNTVSGNNANSNTDAGIYLDWSSNNNKISGNTANYNSQYAGIYLDWSSNNTISDNIVSGRTGISLYNSDTNTISGNTVYNNRIMGIHLRNCNYNAISDNIASDNNGTGIILHNCDNNTISGNNVSNNINSGIYLDKSNTNTITGNTANYNSQYGIHLWNSNYNNISRNNLTYNTPFLDEGGFGNIYENNIEDVPDDLSSLILVVIIIGFSIILLILGSGFIYVMKDKKKKSIQSELIATEEEEKDLVLEPPPESEIKPEFNIFISYSTLDSKYLQIQKCVKNLEKFPEIEKVYFWEVDSKANIVEFMDETLKKTNVFIFFCTENAINSNSVKNEWQAAFQRTNKGLMKIIPVYEDEDLIPPLLGHFLNVKFTKDDFKGFVEKLYHEILR